MNSSETSLPRPDQSVLVIGSPEFHAAYPARSSSGPCPVPTCMDPIASLQRLAEGLDSVVLVDVECMDPSLSDALLSCARNGSEIRIMSVVTLAGIRCRMEAPMPISDSEFVSSKEVGARVSEKVRTRLGSIRLGSEILLSKVRNPRGNVLSDVESLHAEIVDFCESLGFYLDLRVPDGQVSGEWTRFDAFEELGKSMSHALARTGCNIHLSGQPGMVVSGFKRDPSRLVFELLQNSIVHGQARNIWLTVGMDDPTGELLLVIEDDGQGFLYKEIADGIFCLRLGESELRSKGIGVLVCRRILSRYLGRIDYKVKRDGSIRVEVRVHPHLKKPDTTSILAPIGLQVEE